MFEFILAQAASGGGAGSTAMITALGGVIVSLATVYLNSKKQSSATHANTDQITVLSDKVAALETENAALSDKLERCIKKTKKPVVKKPVAKTKAK